MPIIRGQESVGREYLCLGDHVGNRAIRTRDLYLVKTTATSGDKQAAENAQTMLFAKPDDVWDIHNVADQAPDDAAALASVLHQFIQSARQSVPMVLPELPRSDD